MTKNNVLLVGLLIAALVGVGLVVLAIVTGALFLPSRVGTARSSEDTVGQIISRGSGTGDHSNRAFTVPAGCRRQELTYSGEMTSDAAFITLKVYDAYGIPAESAVGPVELADEPSGAAQWTLDAGDYSIEVTASDTEWRYGLTCR